MDVLSDVLRAVRLNGAIFFDMNFIPPFVGESPSTLTIGDSVMPEAERVISFHMLLAGDCFAEIIGGDMPAVPMQAGDVVIFPMGDPNVVSSQPGLRNTPDLANYYRPMDRQLPFVPNQSQRGQAGETRFVCGFFGCDARPFNPLLEALPRLLHFRAGPDGWLTQVIRLAVEESEGHRTGGETVLAKASELLFVAALRSYIEALPADSRSWLAALRDPQISLALRLIHGRPCEDWSVERLARESGLSRSVFADRFAQYVGTAPMHYLGRWRMQLAAARLALPGISIAQAGAEVGYGSEAAFNRAFKKHVGITPGVWRRRHRTPVPAMPPPRIGTAPGFPDAAQPD
jgi:AraC-like DNA-binding protein